MANHAAAAIGLRMILVVGGLIGAHLFPPILVFVYPIAGIYLLGWCIYWIVNKIKGD